MGDRPASDLADEIQTVLQRGLKALRLRNGLRGLEQKVGSDRAVTQLLLEAAPLGYVANIGGESRALEAADRRYRELDGELGSVRSQGRKLDPPAQHWP